MLSITTKTNKFPASDGLCTTRINQSDTRPILAPLFPGATNHHQIKTVAIFPYFLPNPPTPFHTPQFHVGSSSNPPISLLHFPDSRRVCIQCLLLNLLLALPTCQIKGEYCPCPNHRRCLRGKTNFFNLGIKLSRNEALRLLLCLLVFPSSFDTDNFSIGESGLGMFYLQLYG